MWLHVPSTLSQSAPVTVESSLDSEKLSLLERSVMWKSNFQPQRSWQNVWKKDTSIRLLSGLISSPSTQSRGVEKWISSQEAFLVSPSALQETNSEKMTQETSGQIQPDLLGGLGFQSSFLKMCQESSDTTTTPYDPNYERWVTQLRKDYSQRQKQAHLTSVSESLSWPTAQHKDYKRENLPAWEARQQRKAEEGINLQQNLCIATLQHWRTPSASDPEGGVEDWSTERFQNIDAPQIKLRDQTANWPTPNTTALWPTPNASTGGTHTGLTEETALKEVERGNQIGLGAAVALQNWRNKEQNKWPTPTTAEADKIGNRPNYGQVALSNHPAIMGTPERSKMEKSRMNDGNSTNPDIPSTHQDQETEKHGQDSLQDFLKSSQPFAKKGICSPKCRRLNPNFAEHLMGIPVGWTSVSGPLETELYRQWQHALSSYLRRN